MREENTTAKVSCHLGRYSNTANKFVSTYNNFKSHRRRRAG